MLDPSPVIKGSITTVSGTNSSDGAPRKYDRSTAGVGLGRERRIRALPLLLAGGRMKKREVRKNR